MVKMKDRNAQLKQTLGNMPTVERVKESHSIPNCDTVNRQGYGSYSIEDELRLISMLNTLKIEPQAYRSENQVIKELRDLIEKLAVNDPYFVAQCIVYSRCVGEGMRSINHLAAALLSPFISGKEYAKRFYGLWNKKEQKGGCIFRPDDMSEIKSVYDALNKSVLSNSMKKGFASVIENLDSYSLFKYKKTIVDISNLVHPIVKNSLAVVTIDDKVYKSIDAIMKGLSVSADTWEHANSEAGKEVAKAVKEGKLTKEKAEQVLTEAKNNNWEGLLKDNKLGILAALRNIRSMLKSPRVEVIDMLCKLISDETKIINGKIMPYQLDLAYETVINEFSSIESRRVLKSLEEGLIKATPNLSELIPGRNLVIVDCSGSMHVSICDPVTGRRYKSSCASKASLIAAMIAKSTNADIIRFGSYADYTNYNSNSSVFDIAKSLENKNYGGTNLASAFKLITSKNKTYDRIFILSDNECNQGNQVLAYKEYIRRVNSPYIYSIDLASYGTKPLKNDGKVNYYYGYGYSMFNDIASKEFNPKMHIEKVRKIVI